MSTSKPMSDGGKGSVRRNEDTEAYRNNWDNIFGKKKKEKEQPMIEHNEHNHEYEEGETMICPACSGSGEGRYEGETCYKCDGYGEIPVNEEDYDDDSY